MATTKRSYRGWYAGLALVAPLVVVALFSRVHGQIPRPPSPPRMPGFPDGGGSGISGGISGGPRGPSFPRGPGGPSFPNEPRFPRGGPGGVEKIWYCSNCNYTLGKGNLPPSISKCPQCGIRFTNTGNNPFSNGGGGTSSLGLGIIGTLVLVGVVGLILAGGVVGVVLLIVHLNKKKPAGMPKRRQRPRSTVGIEQMERRHP